MGTLFFHAFVSSPSLGRGHLGTWFFGVGILICAHLAVHPPLSAPAFGVGGRAVLLSIAGVLLPVGTVGSPTLFGSVRIGAIWGALLAGIMMPLRVGCRMVLRG